MSDNPLIQLQARVRDLLKANTVLAACVSDFVIEDQADLDATVATLIGRMTSMVIVVTTAKGQDPLQQRGRLNMQEELTVAIMRSNIYDQALLLDAVWEAMKAVNMQPVRAGVPDTRFEVISHAAVVGDPENPPPFASHQIQVRARATLV